jgi:membrane-associated protein
MVTAWFAAVPLAVNVLDAQSLLSAFGVAGIAVVLFAETGLLIGFFLPGDSLLFTAGLLGTGTSSSGLHLSLPLVLLASALGALAGAQCGYLIGRQAGGPMLARTRSGRLKQGAEHAEELLARYGHAKAIVLARFVPVVRTVLNPMAGALHVPARASPCGRWSADCCGARDWCWRGTRWDRPSPTWITTCCRSSRWSSCCR